MASLYEIDNAIASFEFDIDEETGEILNFDELDNLKMAREQKCENIALYYKNVAAEAEMVKAEAKNLTERQKRLEKKAESLKRYLAYALGGEKFSTSKVAISYRKSVSVNIPDESAIADEYCNFTVVKKPDKTMIKNALSAGKEIFGAELVEKQNLQIK